MPYIDRDALIDRLERMWENRQITNTKYKCFTEMLIAEPTADVAEVVRCRDCIHGIPTRIDTVTGEFSDERYCNRHYMCHFEDYYCADGEREAAE